MLCDIRAQAAFMTKQNNLLIPALVIPSGFYRWSDHTLAQAIGLQQEELVAFSDELKAISLACTNELPQRDFTPDQVQLAIRAFQMRAVFGTIPADLFSLVEERYTGLPASLLNSRSNTQLAACDLRHLIRHAALTNEWGEVDKLEQGDFSIVLSVIMSLQITVRAVKLFVETRARHFTNEDTLSGIKLVKFVKVTKFNAPLEMLGAPCTFIAACRAGASPTVFCAVTVQIEPAPAAPVHFLVPLLLPVAFFLFGNKTADRNAIFSILRI